MRIKMELMSDAIFGNGMSIPGGEDVTVLRDSKGFPYYKGGTFKGVFREEFSRYLSWTNPENGNKELSRLLGNSGDNDIFNEDKLAFSDFVLSDGVKQVVLESASDAFPDEILDIFTHLRTFTSISEDGIVEEGTLRNVRCINKGLIFFSNVTCKKEDEKVIRDVLGQIKFIGSMRNRGFGKVKISVAEQEECR